MMNKTCDIRVKRSKSRSCLYDKTFDPNINLLLNLASKLLLYKIYGKIKGRENVNQGNRETGAGITCDRFQSVK